MNSSSVLLLDEFIREPPNNFALSVISHQGKNCSVYVFHITMLTRLRNIGSDEEWASYNIQISYIAATYRKYD
uniref:Uncharacterized protein n=1 Tax=Triticum urartu TaxID=4572 RepID=A0A8R7TJI9_TRIUA